jgi:hypothetical protein
MARAIAAIPVSGVPPSMLYLIWGKSPLWVATQHAFRCRDSQCATNSSNIRAGVRADHTRNLEEITEVGKLIDD